MCHSTDSRPPAPPNPGEVAGDGPTELASADGTVFSAHRATPAGPARGRVILLPDIRGLHPYYRDLAVRFAEAGFDAMAIDYFGRTAGTSARDDDFEWQPHIAQVTPENVRADVAAAIAHLDEQGSTGAVFTVGFCFGGSQSWRLSAGDLDLAGVIGFYGQPQRVRDVIDQMHIPLLLLVAGDDVATSPKEAAAFQAELDAAGAPYEAHTYAGAPHSFFDRSFADWSEACDDAWRQILDFTARQSAPASTG